MKDTNNKTIGIIGGMSWESSVLYYQAINNGVKEKLGGLHSANIIMYSLDFAPIESMQHAGDWQGAGEVLNQAAQSLQRAGADVILIATNTMHKIASQTMHGINLPLLHIVDPTANALIQAGYNKVGLLGTGFTMRDEFYKGRMKQKFNIDVVVPTTSEQNVVHNIIYQELCLGIINDNSRSKYIDVIDNLVDKGVDAIILGCTEITLLIQQEHTAIPLFDTTALHALAAVQFATSTKNHE